MAHSFLWCGGDGKQCELPKEKQSLTLDSNQKLCIGKSCWGLQDFQRFGQGTQAGGVHGSWDHQSKGGVKNGLTYHEAKRVCLSKNQDICSSTDLCVNGQPMANLDKFGKSDNWIAVNDAENEWITYNRAGNRVCKTHSQVAGKVPDWGLQADASGQGFTRAVKCCPKKSTQSKATPPPKKPTGVRVTDMEPKISEPDGTLRINAQGIMFGGPNSNREVNSGQISAGLHIPNSLNIVGMSENKSGPRRVDMWAENGFHVHGHTAVSGDISAKQGNVRIQDNIEVPNGQMRISPQGIMFGGPNKDREHNSAQISAGKHVANSLNIVGMSSGKSHADRRVDMWVEGGLHLHGPIGNDPHVASSNLVMGSKQDKNRWIYHHPNDDRRQVWIAPWNGKDWAWGNAINFHQNGHVHVAKSLNVGAHGDHNLHGWTGANFRRRDGRWTHFDWVGDQRNYIRGNTVSDGIISMQDHQLRLRGMDDPNHYIGWSGAVDGPRIQGHQGGMLATNAGGDKTIASWSNQGPHKGQFKVHQRLLLGDKWSLSGVGDGHANDDWLRLMNADGTNYHGGLAAGRLWTAAGSLSGSDASMKQNIQPISSADSARVHELQPRKFTWKSDPSGQPVYGLVAQEVKKVYPHMVQEGPNGKLSMDYQQLIPLLLSEVKSLKKKVDRDE